MPYRTFLNMKILVCISKVPDTTSRIAFTDNNSRFDTSNVQYIVNPSDEWYALVRALELKEASGGSVTIILVGPAEDDAIIRKALAIGADEAVRVNATPVESNFVAFQIAEYAKEHSFDFIITGKETIDYNGAEVPGMLAEYLDWPYISFVHKLDINGDEATMERDVSGGSEVVKVKTPFVVSSTKGLADQRIPNMRGIMAARTKNIQVVEPVSVPQLTRIRSYSLPAAKGACKMIDPDNMDELVRLLHEEAKVI
jgi:electron transfer flavoprotein beta subunit